MPIEIKHRYSGAVLRTIDADTLEGEDLGKAYLHGANLTGANLSGVDLSGASLGGACLSEADLSGANLTGANLTGATLIFANLRGAMIGQDKLDRLLARATRSDGYEFFLFKLQDGLPKIKAGCRWMTIAEYRAHVVKEYPDTDKAGETRRILNFFEATAEGV
jgi:hypothetical protein